MDRVRGECSSQKKEKKKRERESTVPKMKEEWLVLKVSHS